MFKFAYFSVILCAINFQYSCGQSDDNYEPTWESLDSRPLPKWFDEAKIGVMLHWGVYSVPSMSNSAAEWFWIYSKYHKTACFKYMEDNFPPKFSYQEFAKDFTAEFFNPAKWAKLFKDSGMKYVVLTSKHHDGYALWPSKYSFSWNSKDVGPHRDLVGDLAKAVRKENLHFGIYHSLYEWFNPLYESDSRSGHIKSDFVTKKMIPEMHELIENYKPDLLWSDGDWEANDTYWQSKEFLAWLYNESPVKDTIVVNDRWGNGSGCTHGGYFSCHDNFNPGELRKHKWEGTRTLDRKSWGFRRNLKLSDVVTDEELVAILVETISCGGNFLINVGPTSDGIISPIFEERLRKLGNWLSYNQEAVYACAPWTVQQDVLNQKVWYVTNHGSVYAFVLSWPKTDVLKLGSVASLFHSKGVKVVMLKRKNKHAEVKWEKTDDTVTLKLPNPATVVTDSSAWVLRIK